ncbi:MAG: CvpA family protein [Candidatus Korobacteraceae bacterium]
MMGMSILDWVILLIILLSVLQASAQGFFYEFFSLAGVIVGYLLAAWEYWRVAAWYAPHVNSQWAADIAAFFTIFVVVVLLAGVVGRIARWAVHGVGLRWFDRLLGGMFGFLRGAVLCTVVVLALASFAPQWGWLQQSRIAPFMLVGGRALIWAAPAELRQRFREGWDLLRTVPQHVSLQPGDSDHRL